MKTPDRRRLSLGWIDFLVIAATVLTFGAIVMANIPNGKSSMRTGVVPSDVPVEIGQRPDDPDLVKARIRLAMGGSWS
ncbi:MAG: hypothetical protein Q8K93_27160 [Reyranella sp.]|uniref:hypothetical protein n=1 Tax=Reyranella sp. TaxID=1929291 RepID=UPI00272FF9D1|nr:hypothetical protein [Reyranella sp.]MDP1965873.1 hypothetical protein [Reyranella sp.]MDP2373734.1 hypothetical protein [Reyranella sp.]